MISGRLSVGVRWMLTYPLFGLRSILLLGRISERLYSRSVDIKQTVHVHRMFERNLGVVVLNGQDQRRPTYWYSIGVQQAYWGYLQALVRRYQSGRTLSRLFPVAI